MYQLPSARRKNTLSAAPSRRDQTPSNNVRDSPHYLSVADNGPSEYEWVANLTTRETEQPRSRCLFSERGASIDDVWKLELLSYYSITWLGYCPLLDIYLDLAN